MSKGASTTQKDNSTQDVQLPAWMSQAGQDIFNKSVADSAANPVKPYTGELSAPMSGAQSAAVDQAVKSAGTGQAEIAQGAANVQAGTGKGDRVSTSNFNSAAAQKYMSPYLAAVQDSTVKNMLRDGTIQLQGLGDNAAENHAYGGTREAVAQAEATKGINQNILDYLNQSNQAGYENAESQFNTDANRQLEAGTTNAGLTQQELDRKIAAGAAMGNLGQQASGVNAETINNELKAGGVAQDTQTQADQAAYDEAMRMQDGTVNRDEDLMSILAGTPRNVTTTSSGTSKTTQNPGWLNTALGVGGMAASIYSDARLKRGVQKVGELEDGLPVVEFNYVGGAGLPGGRFRGVIAQDVARIRPQALGPTVNGFATVDPSLAAIQIGG